MGYKEAPAGAFRFPALPHTCFSEEWTTPPLRALCLQGIWVEAPLLASMNDPDVEALCCLLANAAFHRYYLGESLDLQV